MAILLATLAYAIPSRLSDLEAIVGGIYVAVLIWLSYVGAVGISTAMYCAVAKVPVQSWKDSELNHRVAMLPKPQQIKILIGAIAGIIILIPLILLVLIGIAALLELAGLSH